MAADSPLQIKDVPFTGKLVTSVDDAIIGEHFKQLTNMRYTDGNVESVGGMSKVNTTALTKPKVRNGFHYRKSQPAESHLVVQSWDAGESTSNLVQNETDVPDAGDFSATVLHSDTSGASLGRFSDVPTGEMVYCNQKETLVYAGDEMRCAGFVNHDSSETFLYDYTEQVTNTQTDSDNVATLVKTAEGITSDVVLLLHADNNVTDSSYTTPHTVTNTNVTFSTTYKVFGTHGAVFNGSSAYLSAPDSSDFTFTDGTWTVDARIRVSSLAANRPIYYQSSAGGDYLKVYVNTSGGVSLRLYDDDTTTTTLSLDTIPSVISTNTWYHVAVVENGDSYYIFVDGSLKASTTSTARPENMDQTVRIGYDGTTYFSGYMDEYRVSWLAKWTSAFTITTQAYGVGGTCLVYVGSVRPIKGAKFYVGTANATAGASSVQYWDGSSWASCTNVSDGTTSGGVPLAQTGTISFDDTESTAKLKYVNQTFIYWYKFAFTSLDDTTTVYYCTLSASMQGIKDIWDGQARTCFSFLEYNASAYSDETSAVKEEDYSSANTATYVDIDSLGTSDYLLAGFAEKTTGIIVHMVPKKGNSDSATMTVSYWDGDSWVSVSGLNDGTSDSGKSLNKSGVITWTAPGGTSEHKTEISREYQLYYYKLSFSATISDNTWIDYIGGIPAQTDISKYKFPLYAQERLWLCGDMVKYKNSAICSAFNTSTVFNGSDTTTFYFGDDTELTAGSGLYSQFGSSLYNVAVFCKDHETWIVTGSNPDDWVKYQASSKVGCVAPLTMQTAHVGFEIVPGLNRHIAIWQASDGIYLFDGRTFYPIHTDISNVFDKRTAFRMNPDKISDSVGFFDDDNQEYHWLWASDESTSLNEEYVFDLKRQKWYDVNRGVDLQFGMTVKDSSGNTYNYGFIDSGYMERLENGNDFDGTGIACTVWFGQLYPAGSPAIETQVRKLKLLLAAKSNTSNNVAMTHYGDCSSTGTEITLSPSASGKSVAMPLKTDGLGPHTSHSFKFTMTTNNETVGFEPFVLSCIYKAIKIDGN